MSKMNLRPMLRYTLRGSLKAISVFSLVMLLVSICIPLMFVLTPPARDQIHFSAFFMSAAIFSLVSGIVGIREDLRMGIQHGIGRRSSFLSQLIAGLCSSLLLGILGQLLLLLGQALWNGSETVFYTDLYQIVYLQDAEAVLSLGQHLEAALCTASLCLATQAGGMLISLLFYRLNKFWKLVLGIGAPIFFCIVLPSLLSALPSSSPLLQGLSAFGKWFGAAASSWILFFFGAALLALVLDWLLCRKAAITAAK
ncbi:MAG: hypothetical protein IJP07_02805 [Firmicutes bacterium]|nr:hypothetical protein [Bacillota bacterium]